MNEAGFRQYYEQYSGALIKYMRRRIPSEGLSGIDYLVCVAVPAFSRGNVFQWLFTIARNNGGYLRSRSRRIQTETMPPVVMSGETLEKNILLHVTAGEITAQLSRRDAQIVTMRFVYGLEFSEIGHKLNMSVIQRKAVHKLKQRAQ